MRRRIRKLFMGYVPGIAKTFIFCAVPPLYDAFEIVPTSCNIMLTNRCNLRCVMCRQWRERPGAELTAADWKKIIDDLRQNGFRNVHFTGGEPLLREDLAGLVSYCNGRGFTVGMTTNGILLSGDALRVLIDAGLRSVVLSMDALGGQYEAIRGLRDSFGRLETAARVISEARRQRGIDASINFTLMKDNMGAFKQVKEFGDSLGLPVSICLLDKTSSIFNLKDNEERFWITAPEDREKLADLLEYVRQEIRRKPGSVIINRPALDFIARYFGDPRQPAIPCVISQDRIYVDPYGNLYGGCLSMGTFGNLHIDGFRALAGSGDYRSAKKRMFYKRCPGCSCGYLFNIRHMPALILKEMACRIGDIFAR